MESSPHAVGTALDIYTLWVLPAASEREYRSVARAA